MKGFSRSLLGGGWILILLFLFKSYVHATALSDEEIAKVLPVIFGVVLDPDPNSDDDGDGLTNAQEQTLGTRYDVADTDRDGLSDGDEVNIHSTDPLVKDSDNDGLSDGDEVNTYNTNPKNQDTDNDGLSDGFEVDGRLDPLDANGDADLDGVIDTVELGLGLDPLIPDSDFDGYLDSVDLTCGLDPENDIDNDGVCHRVDNCPLVSNQLQDDGDGDGIGDACDTAIGADVDGDGVADNQDNCPNWWNPLDEDIDSDGTPDVQKDSNGDAIGDACQCGDIDGDGWVQNDTTGGRSNDVTEFYNQYINVAGGINYNMPLSALERCDVNADGVCTEADYQLMSTRFSQIQASCPTQSLVTNKALGRLGFGVDQWSKNKIALLHGGSGNIASSSYEGLEKYIDEQLMPQRDNDPLLTQKLLPYSVEGPLYGVNAMYPTIGKDIAETRMSYCNSNDSYCSSYNPIDVRGRILGNAREIKFLRSIYSRWQLDAVLQDFWFNHFNVNARDAINLWSHRHHELTIKDAMYGRFESLVEATAKTPSMMDYLDLNSSSAGQSNENYARELMELHTVGLARDSTPSYTPHQITEVTRILTGWRYQGDMTHQNAYQFYFSAANHDFDDIDVIDGIGKIVTIGSDVWHFDSEPPLVDTPCDGMVLSGTEHSGEIEGKRLICLLSRHERTADRVGTKLIKRFLGEHALYDPDDSGTVDGTAYADTKNGNGYLLADIKTTWENEKGDIKKVLETLLKSDAFKRSLYFQDKKTKKPTVFVASIVRALGQGVEGESEILDRDFTETYASRSFNYLIRDTKEAGEDVYQYPAPTGYSEESPSWTTVAAMFSHFKTVKRLLDGMTTEEIDQVASHLQLQANYDDDDSDGAGDADDANGERNLTQDISRGLGVVLGEVSLTLVANYLNEIPGAPETKIRKAIMAILSTPEFASH